MDLEKIKKNTRWFKEGQIKVKLKNSGNESEVWVTLEGINICSKLVMFDFIDRLKNELMLDVRTKKGCHDQMFFIINSQNAFELIYYLPLFIKEWNIKASTNEIRNTISDEAWYK